jgi:hypothetical protein
MKVVKPFVVIILILAAIIFGLRLLTPEDMWTCQNGTWQRHGHPSTPEPTTPCLQNNVITTISVSPSATATPTIIIVTNKIYESAKMGFSVSLFSDIDAHENLDGTVTFTKWGPTQKVQTELYDGFSINIDQGNLGSNKNLLSLVQADIEQKNAQLSPHFQIIVDPIAYKKTGFYYLAEESSGEVAYFYVYQTPEKFLLITAMVKDPGKLGFKDELGNIIDSITMTE